MFDELTNEATDEAVNHLNLSIESVAFFRESQLLSTLCLQWRSNLPQYLFIIPAFEFPKIS